MDDKDVSISFLSSWEDLKAELGIKDDPHEDSNLEAIPLTRRE